MQNEVALAKNMALAKPLASRSMAQMWRAGLVRRLVVKHIAGRVGITPLIIVALPDGPGEPPCGGAGQGADEVILKSRR